MSQTATFHVPALDCPDEWALIERGLQRVEGIDKLDPDYLGRNLRIEFDPNRTTAGRIVQTIQAAGFPAQIALSVTSAPPPVAVDASISIAKTVVVGGILLLAAATARFIQGETTWLVIALAIASAVVSGTRVAAAAWRAVKLKMFDMNVLMMVAATGAVAIGDVFEAATAMFLFAISLWLERLSLARAHRAIRSLVELSPSLTHRLLNDGSSAEQVEDVTPADLAIGESILIRPGERIPIDGDVASGESSVNQATITGESVPVEKRSGDRVFAGTLNGEGSLVVSVRRISSDTTLSHIARLVEEARASRSPTERFVDAFARRYTPAVIALAVTAMIGPLILASLGVQWAATPSAVDWISRGLVLLVIACPCALVISTPVTIVSGLHQATRHGILVKGGEFLEKAAKIRTIALDKTGTLTTGKMELVAIESFNDHSPQDVLAIAAALERHSEHPLAVAIRTAAEQQQVAPISTRGVTALRGFGVQGELDGQTYYLGTSRLFRQSHFSLSTDDLHRIDSPPATNGSATTYAWLGTANVLMGVIQMADRPRPAAREALAALQRLGVERVAMLTGDQRQAAEKIAREVGIGEVYADLLPQDKINRVRSMSSGGTLAMVGDGVNDAPALAAADLGIALGGQSSDTAMETADVVIMAPDLAKLPTLMRLGRRCRKLLKQNIAFALGTKLFVMLLALAGLATMWMAIAADVGASLLVIANGMRMIQRD
ncbi:MAG: cation-translocating P-type ATPase [Pirellulales bacterium]|nr:cation-translocating P-type ATPase [Pirellulales bacterium]